MYWRSYSWLLVGRVVSQSIHTISVNTASCPSPVLQSDNIVANVSLGRNTPATSRTTSKTTTFSDTVPSSTSDPRYGLAYALYKNPYNRIDDPGSYSQDFLDHVISFADPRMSNFTYVTCGLNTWANISLQNYLDGSFSPYGYLPGHATLTDLGQIAVIMQGYLLIPITGTYIFSATFDDVGLYWLGETAFNPWMEKSSGMRKRADEPKRSEVPNKYGKMGGSDEPNRIAPGVADFSEHVYTAGQLVPFTAVWANAGGRGIYRMNITLPNNTRWTDFSRNLILPLPSDSWVPTPKVSATAQAATCPEPPPTSGDTYCGLTNATGYYSGSGRAIDGKQPNLTATSTFPSDSITGCQAAKNCQTIGSGCYFGVYRLQSQNIWNCVTYGSGTVPAFTVENGDVVEALGYKGSCE